MGEGGRYGRETSNIVTNPLAIPFGSVVASYEKVQLWLVAKNDFCYIKLLFTIAIS